MNERNASPPIQTEQFPLLFSPFRIRGVELRNRFVFQPHFTALGTLEGQPTDAHVAYHEERALGGVGLIIIESQAIHPSGKMSRRFINAWDPAVIPLLRNITDAVHGQGAKIFSQLTHGGHTSLEHPPHIMWAPTQMPEPSSHFSTKAMDEDDIRAVIEGFAVSARNAGEAGFDGIEVKVAHDGLLRSFASPFFNRRTDRYGGSFENRMRLSLEVLQGIKKQIGEAFPVGVRICLNEFTTFGYDLEYGLRMVEALETSGMVDYFNADAGSFSSYWIEIPPAAVAPAEFRKLNAGLKRASRLPVIAFGRITPPQRGEDMLRAGEADLIGMARQLITDPETPNKLKAGRVDLVRVCVACNDACIFQVGQEKAVRCIHNPSAGREREFNERVVTYAEIPRRVVVVGGGPAGLKVAEIAVKRGHQVTVLEREDALGGQVRLAAKQPEHEIIGEVTRYLEAALVDRGVEVRLGVTATPALLRELAAEVIVVATGSEPNLPNQRSDGASQARALGRQMLPAIPGLEQSFVASSDQVLSGTVKLSGNVLVIDDNGHWEAAGTAEYLADRGCQVELIASHSLIGEDIEAGTRTLFYRRAAIKGIRLRSDTVLLEIGEHRVKVAATFSSGNAKGWDKYILVPGEEEWIESVDWVVPIIGRRSREDLFLELKASSDFGNVRIERIGDCVAPRLIQSTVAEAFALAQTL
ncbi:MAG: FAD-dependent oxidoreductase [Verrucomicrobia bacterium]|nr:FAD-dependent oxidoreductase [Verrucomicrobiota bacterium]MBV9298624.1 FAD-dependent oxidoreductase [Verrucomicrobiota bacterium]